MLRIAHLANPIIPISPNVLGSPYSISMIIYLLTEGLLRQGVSVTLFGPTDSKIPTTIRGQHSSRYYKQRNISFDHPEDPRLDHAYNAYLEWVAKQCNEFDLIQNHSTKFLDFAHLTTRPIVTTIHGPAYNLTKKLRQIPNNHFVALSYRQTELTPKVHFAKVIPHGLNLDRFPFNPDPLRRRIVWLGRITPIKGPDVVLRCAERLPEYSFHLAGNIETSERRTPYTKNVLKKMRGLRNVTWVGPVDFRQKISLLKQAQAVLMPVNKIEAFGLVAIEALACGTPVIAYAKGGVAEIIEHERSGFFVRNAREMVAAIRRIDELDRRACRKRVERCFSQKHMTQNYLHLYHQLLKRS